MALMPHLLGVFGLGPIDVAVIAHEPVTVRLFGSRKALSQHCERVIGAGIANALAGRPEASAEPQGEEEALPVPAEAEPLPAGAG
jgi:1-acyl-sn-glycerol-3-phosphate acyltransferase